MSRTKAVGVRELKNRLSAYLREVRLGARVLVLDHDEVVGELASPVARAATFVDNPVVGAWIGQGLVTAAHAAKENLPESPLHMSAGTAARLLDEERGG